MRLARVLTENGPRIASISEDGATPLAATRFGDLFMSADRQPAADVVVDPVMLNPADETTRIFCVGHNYRHHIEEMGRSVPEHPTIFFKLPSATIGPYDDIVLPAHSAAMDWEVELAVIVGADLRDASDEQCRAAVAGYTLINDVTERDWQRRTSQWFLGKNFERTTPLGPVVVTPEDLPHDHAGNVDIEITCEVNGVVRQRTRTGDLVFPVPRLLACLSRVVTLRPGDIIATGTPGGVGAAATPPTFLRPGDTIRTSATGIGSCVNRCRTGPDT
ncbi:fumarylacetoacetate hydrolase family protein [Nonomuraea longicatena]|uniref:Fumarylacetoacetase-like C-terminal domain-containing protein n=1 Tax=Nonomuraea longicatena TaxID=83682 RepID=A0ABN1R5T2_9ACTN